MAPAKNGTGCQRITISNFIPGPLMPGGNIFVFLKPPAPEKVRFFQRKNYAIGVFSVAAQPFRRFTKQKPKIDRLGFLPVVFRNVFGIRRYYVSRCDRV